MKTSQAIPALALVLLSGSACAQTCAAPIPLAGADFAGDTCLAANALGTVCIFGSSPANDVVYSVHLTSSFSARQISLENNTPSWNAALLVLDGPCNGNTVCVRNADSNGAGGNETVDLTGLPNGDYLLIVTSTNGDPSCGSYMLIPSTPVQLQSFDVA